MRAGLLVSRVTSIVIGAVHAAPAYDTTSQARLRARAQDCINGTFNHSAAWNKHMDVARPPRAFLSHSSSDKGFVRQVFQDLGEMYCEMDEATFEPGLFTTDTIARALDRSTVFVLFASQASLKSPWVAGEVKRALELFNARRKIYKIVVYCLDDRAFSLLGEPLKQFNVVRIIKTPRVCARQIRGIFCEIAAAQASDEAFFAARDAEVAELKKMLLNPDREHTSALSISGFDRMGRRQVLRKLVQDLYPSFNVPKHFILGLTEASISDIYRALISAQFGDLTQAEIVSKFQEFSELDYEEQLKSVVAEIRSIFAQREFVSVVDLGGILEESGDFAQLYRDLIAQFALERDPQLFLILTRSVPAKYRVKYAHIIFLSLPPMDDEQTRLYLWSSLRRLGLRISPEGIERIIQIADGHPANCDYVVNSIQMYGDEHEILDNPSEYIAWKRYRALDYLSKLKFSEPERRLVRALTVYRSLPSEFVGAILAEETDDKNSTEEKDQAIRSLLDRNVVEAYSGQFMLSRPLRDAIERDPQFQLDAATNLELAQKLTAIILAYRDEEMVPVELMDAGILAVVQSGKGDANWISNLVLPSQYIWLCRHAYNKREYTQAISYGESALVNRGLLTTAAILEVSRFLGLAYARLGMQEKFDKHIASVEKVGTNIAKGTARFLRGFRHRLNGHLESAEIEFKGAKRLMARSANVLRELLHILNLRQKYDEALEVGREAADVAPTNPYVIDELVKTRIAMASDIRALEYDGIFIELLSRLEKYGNAPGASFYALRQVDLCLRKKSTAEALSFANRAIRLTGDLPTAYGARARVFAAKRAYADAENDIKTMNRIIEKSKQARKHMDYELYLVRYSMNLARKRYEQCIPDLENIRNIDELIFERLRREITFEIQKDRKKVDPKTVAKLKSIGRQGSGLA